MNWASKIPSKLYDYNQSFWYLFSACSLLKCPARDEDFLDRLVVKQQLATRQIPQAPLIRGMGVAIKITPCQYYRHAL